MQYKKDLVVSGCSWTDKNFESMFGEADARSWQKWPEMLAEKLGMNCINMGRAGNGNEYIYSTLIDYIEENGTDNIGLMIAAWTQSQRRDWEHYSPNRNSMKWAAEMFDDKGDARYYIRKTLRFYNSFQIICQHYGINHRQLQMLNMYKDFDWPNFDKHKANETIIQFPHFSNLDEKNFIVKPKCIQSIISLLKRKYKWRDICISERDAHPNALGQKLIFEYVYENI